MKYGFDLDGTLDRPELADLARHLYDGGHEIHVITCAGLGCCRYSTTRKVKVIKLERLKVPYTKLHLVTGYSYSDVGNEKAAIINSEGISVMFDDSSTFCTQMSLYTKAVIMRVREPNDEPSPGT